MKSKNQNRPAQPPQQQQSSPELDPRQEQPTWNDRHPQAPPRDQPERTPMPQERGTPTGISNRSMEEEMREQKELPERGSRQSER